MEKGVGPPGSRRGGRRIALALAAVVAGLSAYLVWRGWDFYRLPIEDRPDHPDFRVLRPTGPTGHTYGLVAALLVAANLTYLLRRRMHRLGLGSMRAWLDVHAATGVCAALLVAFHSAFQLRSPLATATAVSLAVVVLTGLVGRFLHALVPARDEAALWAAIDRIEQVLPGSRERLVAALASAPAPAVPAGASLLRAVAAVPALRRAGRARRRALAAAVRAGAGGSTVERALAPRVRHLQRAAARDLRAAGGAALLRQWRALHRLFAILLFVTVAVHIGVAWHYGYRGWFS